MTRGAVTLVFDDGYEHIYQHVVPLLSQTGLPGVFAIPLTDANIRYRDRIKLRPWRDWLSIKESGHEIASHSSLHQDLTKLSPAQLEEDLLTSARQLGATTLVYPGGAVNQQVKQISKKYYTAARTVHHGFEKNPPLDPMQLSTFDFTRDNFSVWKANLLALYAWASDSWLIETYHIVDNQETEATHTVKLDHFKQHIGFLAKLPIQKVTISQMIKQTAASE